MKTASSSASAAKFSAKRIHIRNILVPIDFSAASVRAISTARHVAQRFAASVHLAHIHESYYPAGFLAAAGPVPLSPIPYPEEARRVALERLTGLAKKEGLSANLHVETGGAVFDEICRIAREIPADLIVASTHGRSGLEHVLVGSTAERLVQHAPCPVLVVRKRKVGRRLAKKATASIDSILVPVDFSECSLAGLQYAIQFASSFAAKIVVLHAVDVGPLLTADGYAMYDFSAYRKLAVEEAERQMERFVRGAKFGTVKYETAVVVAPSVTGICEVARKQRADLIITATHGRTGFKHVLIGSTAEVVVRHAPCSVLVVPSHPEVRTANLGRRARSVQPVRSRSTPARSTLSLIGTAPTRRSKKIARQPFPERRRINKFRESHAETS